ncbi:hypothetical protein ANOBCDAF_04698 [Pleomorphomonas sp. T1.2MG-36]|nr:hypothetical protein ANOBCDAF_04698 [Pleomorphomonas sp. T1.2MG-36]
MRKARRHPELLTVVGGEFHLHMLAVGRRAPANVDGHIQDCADEATDELALRPRVQLEVQAAHRADLGRHRLVVLNKMNRTKSRREQILAKRLDKITTRVAMATGNNKKQTI